MPQQDPTGLRFDHPPFLHACNCSAEARVWALVERLTTVRHAASFLLALKDGPRDDYYAAAKDHAWQMLRDALQATEDAK